ncbi:MAG: heme exporter protein CcmB [bacterium]|nr:heme exporter protein CcmB [bacterium]
MKTPFFKTVFAIVRKDLRAELRSRELVSAMLLFALLSVLVFSFALELNRTVRQEVVSGALWVTLIFASILGLNRSLAMERDQGNLDAMFLAPVDRTAIFFGKMIGNFLFTAAVGLLLLPIMTILYNLTLTAPALLLTLTLGVLGLSAVGTLLATMTVQTRTRETLLPIVMLPVVLPILLTVVRASSEIIQRAETSVWLPWVQILVVVDVIYLVLCYLLFEYVVED